MSEVPIDVPAESAQGESVGPGVASSSISV